ncbi:Lipid transfer protein/Par allergen [Parasponia andersonii]|uniref:Lipid transfer protein/Par allergen n=1 Tax=Parasponia andersonii TaxID=3476 RepID=A0A2P5BQ30_PARAD|nr:Lipid transfer protein/Par allergen [Parasponia andersonii]
MGKQKMIMIGVMVLLSWASVVSGEQECSTVAALFSSCSNFVTYGPPDPFPESPCCYAMKSLTVIAGSVANRRFVCRCLTGLISIYKPNSNALSSLPGFCGVSLGFTIDLNTDCNL